MCIWNVKSTNIYRSEKFFEQTLQRHLQHKFHVRYVFDLSFTVFDMIKQQIADAIIYLFIQLRTAALRLIVRSGLDVPTFATRRLHACHHARASSGGRWNCEREMSGNFA